MNAVRALLPVVVVHVAAAQTVTVRGIAYDSLHGVRLGGAVISLAGSAQTAVSDSQGIFVFDSVMPGAHAFVMQHDVLDALGLSGAATRARITDGRDTVRIAVPSFAQLWRVACGSAKVPADSGFVFGTVREAGGRVHRGATVTAQWIDVSVDTSKHITQHSWQLDIETDSLGGYALCGVPASTGIQISASADSSRSGMIDIGILGDDRVRRRDLLLGATASAVGVVAGLVTSEKGPVANAHVSSEGGNEVVTGSSGRFVLRNVPVGTQQIEARAIGLDPVTVAVDVTPSDTARADFHLVKLTMLDSVHVEATNAARQALVTGFIERRRTTVDRAYFRDSSTLGNEVGLAGMFKDMPAVYFTTAPGRPMVIRMARTGGCEAKILVDKVYDPYGQILASLRPQDIAAMEVYLSNQTTPVEFAGSPISSRRSCGTVVIWTKRGWP